jgi:hypothetical protein
MVVGIMLLLIGLGGRLPDEATLKMISGKIKTVIVIDSLSDKATTLPTPLNEIHFTLSDQDTTFRYPSGWPGYGDLYDRLAFEINVWVDPGELGNDEPVTIYRLEQRLPKGFEAAPISVSYQAIVETQSTQYQSYLKAGPILVGIGVVLLVFGVTAVRWNRRHR